MLSREFRESRQDNDGLEMEGLLFSSKNKSSVTCAFSLRFFCKVAEDELFVPFGALIGDAS